VCIAHNAAPRPAASPPPGPGQASPSEQAPSEEGGFGGGAPQPRVTADAGLNRFVWDMRHAEAVRFPGLILWAGEMRGPRIVPGTYQIELTVREDHGR